MSTDNLLMKAMILVRIVVLSIPNLLILTEKTLKKVIVPPFNLGQLPETRRIVSPHGRPHIQGSPGCL